MLFLSFLASFFPGFFEPACLFKAHVYIVGLVTHYSCCLGLMVFFNYSYSQFLVALIIGLFFSLGFPQMALNNGDTVSGMTVGKTDRQVYKVLTSCPGAFMAHNMCCLSVGFCLESKRRFIFHALLL